MRRRDRAHDRQVMFLLEIIREQNDRIMQLAGQPWNLPPREVPKVEPDPDEGRYVYDVAGLPDN